MSTSPPPPIFDMKIRAAVHLLEFTKAGSSRSSGYAARICNCLDNFAALNLDLTLEDVWRSYDSQGRSPRLLEIRNMGRSSVLMLYLALKKLKDNLSVSQPPPPPPPTCQTCRFLYVVVLCNDKPNAGECRRFPPLIKGDGETAFSDFAYVAAASWCGEHQPKEENT
jgi:hypothetical protein